MPAQRRSRSTIVIGLGILVALLLPASVAQAAPLLTEGFDDVSALTGSGWVQVNNSAPLGTIDWFQGNDGVFPAQAGAPEAYVAANFLNADLGGDISNWLILPELTLVNGDEMSFYTRSAGFFPDRLEVRYASGSTTDVGGTAASVGDFTTLLLAINPALSPGGYPTDWTPFSVALSGLVSPTGRLAFRYSVTDTSANGDYIGVDTVAVTRRVVPEPAALALLGIGLVAAACHRRRA